MRRLIYLIMALFVTQFWGNASYPQHLDAPIPIDPVLISVSTNGYEGNAESQTPTINADGRFIAFQSWASNLVPNDTNDTWDIFVRDRLTGQTSRVSVASDGIQANGKSINPSISGDGRYVAFESIASNLVSGTNNFRTDIFVHDRQTGETARVSIGFDGRQANGNSYNSSISADGRYVAFTSLAYNLVPHDTNNKADIFVYDRLLKKTTRASVASDGTQTNDHSADASMRTNGRFIAFTSGASNLVAHDTNNNPDVFIHDMVTGETRRVSLSSEGTQANGTSARPRISLDGDYVVFTSNASNLVPNDTNNKWDIFFHDTKTGKTSRMSLASDGTQGNGNSTRPRLSRGDGRFVVFSSEAANLAANTADNIWNIYIHDRQTGMTRLISANNDGKGGNQSSDFPAISTDGKFIAFDSWASNLVGGAINSTKDIFVTDNPF